MKVGFPIDILEYGDGLPGIETYAWQLIRNLHQNHREEVELELYEDEEEDPGPFGNFPIVRFPRRSVTDKVNSIKRMLFFRNKGPDIIHYTSSFSIPHRLRSYKTIMTIHDLVPVLFPETCRADTRYNPQTFSKAAERVDHFITVSNHTAEDVVKYLGIDRNKLTVVYNGVSPDFKPRKELGDFRKRSGLEEPYLLHVGTLEPRKNIPILLEAFSRLHKVMHRLVLVGKPGWGLEETNRAISELNIEDRVILKGYIPEEELPFYYNAADLLVFPTQYEGFGIPIIEAMASGTPVIASNISSIPEIVGENEAAILVEPDNPDKLLAAIENVLGSSILARRLRENGLARAKHFSWARCASETFSVYKTVFCNG